MSAWRVDSATNSWCSVPLVIPSTRDAVFTVSPIVVYSIRRTEPTWPDITSPLLRPIPIRNPSPRPASRIHSQKAGRRTSSMSRAASSARSAWSGCSIGAPKTAMIPSPI